MRPQDAGTAIGMAYEQVTALAQRLDGDEIDPDMVRWSVDMLRHWCDQIDQLPTRWGETLPVEMDLSTVTAAFRTYASLVEGVVMSD